MSEKPEKPDESDCCGSGCKPCIFDIYEERLKKWESKRETITESKALNQIKYLPFLITKIDHVTDFIKIIKFQSIILKNSNSNTIHMKQAKLDYDYDILNDCLFIKPGEYLILKGIFENEIISRSYTPVLERESFQKGTFTIIISLQPNGKMSDFFMKLMTNDIVFWRGPYTEIKPNLRSFKHVLLFGGGTGVVPLYNISKSIVDDDESETWVKFFASFKSTANIILRSELGLLRNFWNFQINIYITDKTDSEFQSRYNETIIISRIDETVIENEVKKCGGDEFFVFVCGPEGFNNFVKNCFYKFGVKDDNIFIFY